MAGSTRRFSLSAILLPLLFLTMSGLARAAIITVANTQRHRRWQLTRRDYRPRLR